MHNHTNLTSFGTFCSDQFMPSRLQATPAHFTPCSKINIQLAVQDRLFDDMFYDFFTISANITELHQIHAQTPDHSITS